jgi:hypothetical protein
MTGYLQVSKWNIGGDVQIIKYELLTFLLRTGIIDFLYPNTDNLGGGGELAMVQVTRHYFLLFQGF